MISAGGALARRDVGRELGREANGVGSRGGAGPLRVRAMEGRRERDDDVLGLRISVGVGRVEPGVEALEVEGAAAAKGTVVVVVVVVVVVLVAGSAGGGGLRLLTVGLSGDAAVSKVVCAVSACELSSRFRFLGGEDFLISFSLSLSLVILLKTLLAGPSEGGLKMPLKEVPMSASFWVACSIPARANASCSLARFSFFNFFASFNFMPRLLSCSSPKPSEAALISPGASCFPGAVVAILSSSIRSSPVASAFALASR